MVAIDVLTALREGSAVLERPEVRTLALTGPDRARFLNGMVSNEVEALKPGEGTLAVKTSNKGRVEGLLRVRALEDRFELDVLDAAAEKVLKSLAAYIIMDDCAIADVSKERDVVAIYGPSARSTLSAIGYAVPEELAPHHFVVLHKNKRVIREATLGLDGYELHAPFGEGRELVAALLDRGAKRASWQDLDVARVEAGVPIDGRDLDEEVIPMEAHLERAISTTKGCYIGQEVIARATNLGGVKHALVGVRFVDENSVPPEGTPLYHGTPAQKIGELTSVVYSPNLKSYIALGYVHKKFEAPGTIVAAVPDAGAPIWQAQIASLPFVSKNDAQHIERPNP